MPKGNRGGQKKTKVYGRYANSVTIGSNTFEYDGTLIVTSKDTHINSKQRKSLENWETKRFNNNVEWANVISKNANEYGEIKGKKGSVGVPYYYHMNPGTIFTHIHPRIETGVLGGTFSKADIHNFSIGNNVTARAVAKEGTYSISKKSNFDMNLNYDYSQYVKSEVKKVNKLVNKLSRDLSSGKITSTQVSKECEKVYNTLLVNLHTWLYDNQKTYGYDYYLEKRS